jgi:imidazolonepropionase-like amidohydrolase
MRTGWSALPAWLTTTLIAVSAPDTGAQRDPSDVVFGDVRVFDGERVLPSATVTIANGTIASVAQKSRDAPNAVRIDGRGLTLLPGLIDAHDHTGGRRESLRDAARFGVTTIVDLFDRPERMRALRREVTDAPSCAEASYFSAGLGATVKGGHAYYSDDQRTVTGPADAEAFVRERVTDGSEYIKIIVEHGFAGKPLPALDAATVKALIDAAHRSGKLAIAHATWPGDVRMVVESGADGLAHLWVSSRGKPGDDDQLVRLIKTNNIFVVPTLTMAEALTTGEGSASLLADARLAPYLTDRAKANLKPARAGSLTDPITSYYENLNKLHRAGVPIVAGTDAPNAGVEHGISLHRELELLVNAGLTPLDALKTATSSAATAFRLTGHGRIVPGAPADLVLVKGDPTKDVLATRNIVSVWRCGRQVDRDRRDAANHNQ